MFGLVKLKLMLATVAAVLLAVAGAFLKGRQSQAKKDYEKRLKDYQNTRKRMDEADPQDDPHDARDWLRKRK